MPTRPLAYTIESHMVAGAWNSFVVAKCARCTKAFEVRWHGYQNPNFVARHFNRIGWDFDAYRQSGNKCPSCNKSTIATVALKAPDLNKFSDRLKWTREQIHLSRDDLATEAGINRRILDHLEDGTVSQRYEELHVSAGRKLAAVLIQHGAPIDANWLIGINDNTNILALNLRRICDRSSTTEGQLSLKSGVPISVIHSIFNGALSSTHHSIALAKALDVDLEVLIGGDISKIKPAIMTPELSPTPELAEPELEEEELTYEAFFDLLTPQTLREERDAQNLTQGELATIIMKMHDVPWKFLTVRTMISKIERGDMTGAVADEVMALAAMALNLDPAPSEDQPETETIEPGMPAEPTTNGHAVDPEPQHGLALNGDHSYPMVSQPIDDTLLTELRRAENDLNGLRDILADIEPVRLMMQETAAKIDNIKEVLAASAAISIGQQQQSPKFDDDESEPETHQFDETIIYGETHLKFIGGTWFFRRVVPVKAREIFGITEVRHSLNTASRIEAQKRKIPYERAFEAKLVEAMA